MLFSTVALLAIFADIAAAVPAGALLPENSDLVAAKLEAIKTLLDAHDNISHDAAASMVLSPDGSHRAVKLAAAGSCADDDQCLKSFNGWENYQCSTGKYNMVNHAHYCPMQAYADMMACCPKTCGTLDPTCPKPNIVLRSSNYPSFVVTMVNANSIKIKRFGTYPTGSTKFDVVQGFFPGTISFYNPENDCYLREVGFKLRCHPESGSNLFKKGSSFYREEALNGKPGYTSYRNYVYSDWYIVHIGYTLKISKRSRASDFYKHSLFAKEASWLEEEI